MNKVFATDVFAENSDNQVVINHTLICEAIYPKIVETFPENTRKKLSGIEFNGTKVFNLTSKDIKIKLGNSITTVPKSGGFAEVKKRIWVEYGNFLIENIEYKSIKGLPEERENTFFLVEEEVFLYARRKDLLTLSNQMKDLMIDEKGRVVGSLFLRRFV